MAQLWMLKGRKELSLPL
ncbi:hypothetical protein E2C01_073340 [Portunus trituberculatus]|uniref:Uncharacterized protein n=1 Tax=Portunus trituberculatus TaxID=210409 RepID=A0A5B7I541_PORTR|nr:hypothetical protein [Portunus trituberculatus]